MIGNYFVMLKQEGCAVEVKVARDQDNIFLFELFEKIIMITLFSCKTFSTLLLSYYIQRRLKGLSA